MVRSGRRLVAGIVVAEGAVIVDDVVAVVRNDTEVHVVLAYRAKIHKSLLISL